MISVKEVVSDPDMIAPQPYTILRSTGKFVPGGFQSMVMQLPHFGPVQQASNKEIQMLPEADRVGALRSFWCTQPLYTTRGYAPVPGTQGAVPTGAVPGTVYTLPSILPTENTGSFYINGLLQIPNVNYTLVGNVITMAVATPSGAKLYFEWPITAFVQPAASDIIQYENEQYRLLQVYRDPGSGYWKGIGTRLAAA